MILTVLLQLGCSQKVESLEDHFNCKADDKIYITNKEFKATEFSVYHPRNWKTEITNNEPYTSYVFSDTIPELTDKELTEISDEEFMDRYNEFTSLTLTQDKIYEGFNYEQGWNRISTLLKSKDEFEILENGMANYNGLRIQWTKYIDNSNAKDSLINLSLATCLIGEQNYLTIQACVFGEKEIEERMCKLIGVINTITVK